MGMMSEDSMPQRVSRPRRSVLYVPAGNPRALAKLRTLTENRPDCVVLDLEDSILPEDKPSAREALRTWFGEHPERPFETIIRINALSSAYGTEDLLMARGVMPDAILLPKIDEPDDVRLAVEALEQSDAPDRLRLWAMIETPRGVMNVGAISRWARGYSSRLDSFVVGTNDLAKDTGVSMSPGRPHLSVWLMQIVVAARAYGLDVIDGVFNDFKNIGAYEAECVQGAAMGFDGKSLIHPVQIAMANSIFGPSAESLREAREIVGAFARTENHKRGVISLNGKMVERLHLEQAEMLLAKARMIESGS